MTDPFGLDPLAVELLLDGWNDIADDVYKRGGLTISRGIRNEGSVSQHATLQMQINNRSGTYSPRNPSSTHFGVLGRNTPLRVRTEDADTYLWLPGFLRLSAANWFIFPSAATPDDGGDLNVADDLDVRADLDIGSWRGDAQGLARKWIVADDRRSWFIALAGPDGSTLLDHEPGRLVLGWSNDGSTILTAVSTERVPIRRGRLAVRATLDVDDGASGHEVTFYTADTIDGSWTQLGDPVVDSGTTSVNTTTVAVEVGNIIGSGVSSSPIVGKLHGFRLLDGIGGGALADPDFTGLETTDVDLTDGQGNEWTWEGNTYDLADLSVSTFFTQSCRPIKPGRLYAEVSEWPPEWDVTGNDVWVTVEASGILRRLSEDKTDPQSPIRRAAQQRQTEAFLAAYWPLEDGSNTTRFASAIEDHPPMRIGGTADQINPSSYSDFAGSRSLPVLNGASLWAEVPPYTEGATYFRGLFGVPTDGLAGEQTLIQMPMTGGDIERVRVQYDGGALTVEALDDDGAVLDNTTSTDFQQLLDGRSALMSLELVDDGSDMDVLLFVRSLEPGAATSGSALVSDTFAGLNHGRARRVATGALDDTAVGHIMIGTDQSLLFGADEVLTAHIGEAAGRRIQRICFEEQIPLQVVGDLDDTTELGPQQISSVLDILRESEAADLGLLYETRDELGLTYRTRTSVYSADPVAELDYSSSEFSPPLRPTDDTQHLKNDVTVKRLRGSETRVRRVDGPLSVLKPPDGVGSYPTSPTVSLAEDGQILAQAGWRLHLGTWDEQRWPKATLEYGRTALTADPDLVAAAQAADTGDVITVENLPAWIPPELLELQLLGYRETLLPFVEHSVTWNLRPAAPRRNVFVLGDSIFGRLDTAGSELAAAVDASDTSLLVATDSGKQPWITDAEYASMFPFNVRLAGEVVRVTAISDTSSPQTFTVVRAVNGVSRAWDAGAQVRLCRSAVGL